MKTPTLFRFALLATIVCVALPAPALLRGADAMPAVSPAEAAFQAFEAAYKQQPPKPLRELTPRERARWSEEHFQLLRENAEAFFDRYPDDPRRWSIVLKLRPTQPRFVREWGPDGADGLPTVVVDEPAAAAWKAKVIELRAALERATDQPEDVKKMLASREEIKGLTEAFKTRWESGRSEPAPDFVVKDLSGREVKLSDYHGKVVVLDFWATWCGPCIAAFPHTQVVAANYRNQGVVVIASCTMDTRENFEKWVPSQREKYPDLIWAHDPAGKSGDRTVSNLYGVLGIPTQFVINREGKVVDVVKGHNEGDVRLEAALAKAGIKVDAAILSKAEADLKNLGAK